MRRLLTLATLLAAAATSVLAQTYPAPGRPYGAYPGGDPAAIADLHRYENERLRAQSQANADQARQQQIQTQLRLRAIESAREPTAPSALPARPLYGPEQERTLRQSAADRRQETAQGMSQIDSWLDLPQ